MSPVVLLNFSVVEYNTNYGLVKKYFAEDKESEIGVALWDELVWGV